MKTLLCAWLLLFSLLCANQNDTTPQSSDYTQVQSLQNEQTAEPTKVLYLSYEKIPTRILKGEIFEVTLKTISTIKNFRDISYNLPNAKGLKLLKNSPNRVVKSQYYYDTFYFVATQDEATLPDFTAILTDQSDRSYPATVLAGEKLNIIPLNPSKDFSNIVAQKFDIAEYKTTSYDASHNIVVFIATAYGCDISSLKLKGVYKQGIESITESHADSKIIYYAIIDKKIESLSFSYFNLTQNRFIPISIPIIVNDDSVTTQSDLKPKDLSNEMLKMGVATVVAIIAFIMYLWKRNRYTLLFIFILLGYILYIGIPSKEVCIKAGTKIYLLPVSNGTIFETTPTEHKLQKEDEIKGWVKVQLENQKIGWVKNEDTCSH